MINTRNFHIKCYQDSDDYKIFEKNFKSAVKLMFAAEKENLFENYSDILKCLLNVYRNFDEVISQVVGTLDFIGNSSNKLTALNHWGKNDKFNRLAGECLPDFQSFFETGKNIELYLKFVNRFVVNLQDVFDYDESLKLGNFDIACQIIDSALNISIKNPKAEDFKNFSVWEWHHFAKFSERLINFEIVKHALEISRAEFLNYRNKIGNTLGHPDYITFSKMATCFDILGKLNCRHKVERRP